MFRSIIILFLIAYLKLIHSTGLNDCPMPAIKQIIKQENLSNGEDAPLQMQLIRNVFEYVYGGTWGVIIVQNADLVSTYVHWTIPDHLRINGSQAFCLFTEKNWQYNVFKTGN